MAYDEKLAGRVREALGEAPGLVEKKMFGGIGYMVLGNMACGVHGDNLIVRVGPAGYEPALAQPHARPFDLTGRAMKGWVYVDPAGCETAGDLGRWVQLGIDFALSLPPKA
jgi:hypothetical protein